jgi:hypothetical protein
MESGYYRFSSTLYIVVKMHNLDIFKKICDDNKEKISMSKSVNYPLNYKKGSYWASSHCDNMSIKFAKQIIEKTIYISFEAFIEQLKKICMSFKKHYSNQKDVIFILILPFTINKSNFWVSMLCNEWIGNMINDVYFSLIDVYNHYIYDGKAGLKKIVCIICDDCAYTGSQLNGYCSLVSTKLKYKDKPKEPLYTDKSWLDWKNKVIDHVSLLEKSIDINKFSINLIVPYMGSLANDMIQSNKIIMLPRDIKKFNIFRDEIDIKHYSNNVLYEFENSFQYHTNISSIYFDHKVADAISTFNKIYLLAPVFGCSVTNSSLCFIDGCCNDDKIQDDINIYTIYINIEDNKVTCPPTFYKSIKYTYCEKLIDTKKSVKKIFKELSK